MSVPRHLTAGLAAASALWAGASAYFAYTGAVPASIAAAFLAAQTGVIAIVRRKRMLQQRRTGGRG